MHACSRSATLTVALGLACLGVAHAQSLRVVKEFPYPTEYDVTPIYSIVNGQQVQVGTTVTPTAFAVREVGVRLDVHEAIVVSLAELENAQAELGARTTGGTTPLMVAAATGARDEALALIRRGVNVNVRNRSGSTALMGAAAGGHLAIVDALLDRRALVNTTSSRGFTALMFAARNGHTAVVQRLLERGARTNTTDDNGYTALMYASAGGYTDVAQALIEDGANVNRSSREGVTPLAIAKADERRELVVLLTRAGAWR